MKRIQNNTRSNLKNTDFCSNFQKFWDSEWILLGIKKFKPTFAMASNFLFELFPRYSENLGFKNLGGSVGPLSEKQIIPRRFRRRGWSSNCTCAGPKLRRWFVCFCAICRFVHFSWHRESTFVHFGHDFSKWIKSRLAISWCCIFRAPRPASRQQD